MNEPSSLVVGRSVSLGAVDVSRVTVMEGVMMGGVVSDSGGGTMTVLRVVVQVVEVVCSLCVWWGLVVVVSGVGVGVSVSQGSLVGQVGVSVSVQCAREGPRRASMATSVWERIIAAGSV